DESASSLSAGDVLASSRGTGRSAKSARRDVPVDSNEIKNPAEAAERNGVHAAGGAGVTAPSNGRASTERVLPPVDKGTAVLDEVRKIAKGRSANVSLDSSISDLGLDSLERMEILASLEERFGGRFPQDVKPELETCRQVLEAVEMYLG